MSDQSLQVIGVLIAFVGLFTGAAGGVYAGGVHRAQLEDRREILRSQHLARLRSRDPEESELVLQIYHGAADHDERIRLVAAGWALGILLDMQAIHRIVRLLPWKDRALWAASGPIVGARPLVLGCVDSADSVLGAYETLRNNWQKAEIVSLDQFPAPETLHRFQWQNKDYWECFAQGLREFEVYLVHRVNPGLSARYANLRTTARLYWRGPRWWDASVRLSDWERAG